MTTQINEAAKIIFSEVSFISPEEMKEKIESGEINYCPENIYIREKLPSPSAHYQDALTLFDSDGNIYHQILFPICLYKENGKDFIINGNSRVINYLSMHSKSEDISKFRDIPINYIQNNITESLLLEIQKLSNDTTLAHGVIEKLIKAESFLKSQQAKYIKSGLTKSEANQKAQEDVRRVLGSHSKPISQPQFSKVINVAKVSKENALFRNIIENEQLIVDLANQVLVIYKKINKKEQIISLDFMLMSLLALAANGDRKTEKGLSIIEPKHLQAYEDSLGVVRKPKKEDKENEVDAVDEEDLSISNPNSNSTKKQIPLSQVTYAKEEFMERFNKLNVESVIEKPSTSNLRRRFVEKAFEFLLSSNKFFGDDEVIEALSPVIQILKSRLEQVDVVIADNPEIFEKIRDNISNLSAITYDLNHICSDKSKSEEIDNPDEETEEINYNPDDDNPDEETEEIDDNSDVFGD